MPPAVSSLATQDPFNPAPTTIASASYAAKELTGFLNYKFVHGDEFLSKHYPTKNGTNHNDFVDCSQYRQGCDTRSSQNRRSRHWTQRRGAFARLPPICR